MTKKYIKNFFYRDQKALMSVSRCGHVTHQQLKNFVADSRIKNYIRDGYMTREVFTKPNGITMEGYKLTRQGREFVEKNYGFRDHQHAQSLNHDLGIANKYFSLTEEQRETWRTETELRNLFEEQLNNLYKTDYDSYQEIREQLDTRQISMPDCSYVTEQGIEVAYEVITNSYGITELQAKERYIEITKMQYETERR